MSVEEDVWESNGRVEYGSRRPLSTRVRVAWEEVHGARAEARLVGADGYAYSVRVCRRPHAGVRVRVERCGPAEEEARGAEKTLGEYVRELLERLGAGEGGC